MLEAGVLAVDFAQLILRDIAEGVDLSLRGVARLAHAHCVIDSVFVTTIIVVDRVVMVIADIMLHGVAPFFTCRQIAR